MRIFGLNIFREAYPKRRFGELFNPTVLNFSVWLATASFCFFIYSSLSRQPNMSTIDSFGIVLEHITAYVFLGFGVLCVLLIGYLFVTWIIGIRVKASKSAKQVMGDTDSALETLQSKVTSIRDELDTLDQTIVNLQKTIQKETIAKLQGEQPKKK